jgi:acyl carrier protein
MITKIFLEKLQEALEEDATLTIGTKFVDLSNFDSMSIMMLIAFVDDNFNQKISAVKFKEIEGVSDLMSVIGLEHFV